MLKEWLASGWNPFLLLALVRTGILRNHPLVDDEPSCVATDLADVQSTFKGTDPRRQTGPKCRFSRTLADYSLSVPLFCAIGNTISCDAPYSAIGFRGKLFLRYPFPRPVFGLRHPFFKERSGGVAAIVCDTTGSTVRQGYCYTCLAIGGGYFRRVTKLADSLVLLRIEACRGRRKPRIM